MKINGHEIKPGANLRYANLRYANLYGANLTDANLTGANLRYANLHGADLRGANLHGADLRGANLRVAYLAGADLQGADLTDANLRVAYLAGADLQGADLTDANLVLANLYGANLRYANLPPQNIPSHGMFTGWKRLYDGQVIEVEIPAEARRCHALGSRKCRAEFVVVKSPSVDVLHQHLHNMSKHTMYRTGQTVHAKPEFCDDIRLECAPGIYFYLTKEEAEISR